MPIFHIGLIIAIAAGFGAIPPAWFWVGFTIMVVQCVFGFILLFAPFLLAGAAVFIAVATDRIKRWRHRP